MQMLDHTRWHLVLTIVAGLLALWIPWQVVAILVVMILFERGFRQSLGEMQRQAQPSTDTSPAHRELANCSPLPAPAASRTSARIPIELIRTLGADCSVCTGIGCPTCAHTGLH